MILKAAGLGFLYWIIATAVFYFFGPQFFVPDSALQTWLFVACVPICVVLTVLTLKLVSNDPGDRAEAAIAIAFPGMLMDVFVTQNFQQVFPAIDPMLGQTFGALMLLAYAAIIFTGLMMTRISEKDERL